MTSDVRDGSCRWRKKPVEVDAWQVTYEDRWAVAAWCDGRVSGGGVVIPTLEGDMFATSGDWVIGPYDHSVDARRRPQDTEHG